jgi:alkylglycerol monooxygenase
MQEYARVLTYAIPFFLLLIGVEWLIGIRQNKVSLHSFDTISSLSSGITNTVKQVLNLSVVIISYEWFYDHFALLHIASPWYLYVIGFIGLDFAGYWTHRFEHVINIFWNRHIIHHSSEEFNLACALRQNISAIFNLFTFLLLPCALLGVPPNVIAVIAPLHLFAQFWYHTVLIDKMGILEKIIVTPSHHRVHHAINDIYLDKNYGQIFIIWDKMFGTYQEELDDVPPVYGVKRQVMTWNPLKINFQHLFLLLKDAFRTKSWIDKIKVWFMPTGWRPSDVAEKYPVAYIVNPDQQVKYSTQGSMGLHVWSWATLLFILGLMFHMFAVMGSYQLPELLTYGLFLMLSVYICTALMDHDKSALLAELLRLCAASVIVYAKGQWFGINAIYVYAYLAISMVLSLYFLFEKRELNELAKA